LERCKTRQVQGVVFNFSGSSVLVGEGLVGTVGDLLPKFPPLGGESLG